MIYAYDKCTIRIGDIVIESPPSDLTIDVTPKDRTATATATAPISLLHDIHAWHARVEQENRRLWRRAKYNNRKGRSARRKLGILTRRVR